MMVTSVFMCCNLFLLKNFANGPNRRPYFPQHLTILLCILYIWNVENDEERWCEKVHNSNTDSTSSHKIDSFVASMGRKTAIIKWRCSINWATGCNMYYTLFITFWLRRKISPLWILWIPSNASYIELHNILECGNFHY